jgi:chemotaxis protein methyltransferase CheR
VIGAGDVDRFRRILTRWVGLALDGTTADTLAGLLADRALEAGCPPGAYLDHLAQSWPPAELDVLAGRLTVPETYFFRNEEQFHALADVVVPARTQGRASDRTLRLLSMGCATGEEPYTLAIVVREALGWLAPGWSVSVLGVDVNPAVLERAERGRFAGWSLRATPEVMLRRWFRPDGDGMALDEEIRRSVRFVTGNLADSAAEARWWSPETYDVIFCRNVLIYLTAEHAAAAVARLVTALAPGGFLFLGHAETGHGRTAGVDLRHSHNTFYFQRGGPAAIVAEPARPSLPLARRSDRPPTHRAGRPPARPARAAHSALRPTQRALDLLRQERFEDAFAQVASESGPEALLLRAVLLADLGRLADAEAECHRLIDSDALNAGAHYLLAVCREGTGDVTTARSYAGTAAYLDPGFAMPRLRLGLLAQRRGDVTAARHEFAAALTLLAGESDRRLLLFGGGFTRAALIALCRAGLDTSGSAA